MVSNRKARMLLVQEMGLAKRISARIRVSNRRFVFLNRHDGYRRQAFGVQVKPSAAQTRACKQYIVSRDEARDNWARLGLHMQNENYDPKLFGGAR